MLSARAYSFRQKSKLAISLSWIGGYANVVLFILCGAFSSHMTGNATQLGRFDVSISLVANATDGTAVGTYEYTAANGDTLTADFTERFTPTDVPGVFSDVIRATITGGTGRFAGATGSFVAYRVADHATGIVSDSFEGTISTPR